MIIKAIAMAAPMPLILVFIGGGLGSAARYGISALGIRWWGAVFPWPTLVINVLGSFLMGALVGWFSRLGDAHQDARLFLATGVLGGFTTFSTFSLEAVLLVKRGEWLWATGYVSASLVLGLGALAAAMRICRLLN